MTKADMKKEIIKIASVGGVDKEATCMYKGRKDRFCTLTTQESCRGCSWYEPTTEATYEYAYGMINHCRRYEVATAEVMKTAKQLRECGMAVMPGKLEAAVKVMRSEKKRIGGLK